jgi:hypothetical protein
LRVVPAAFGRFWPWPLRVTVVSLSVTVSTLARVLCVAFRLCAYVSLASLMVSLGNCVLTLLR